MKQAEISLQELLEAGVHFGHQPQRWCPRMKPYLYGKREGVHIFDLIKTKKMLEEACDFVSKSVAAGKVIIFVGTKRQAAPIIVEEAKRADVPYVSQRWLGGSVTNWEQIKRSIDKLAKMKSEKEAGDYGKFTKKENLLIDREIARLEKFFGGLSALKKNPDILFIVDIKREEAAVKEAKKKEIPIVAIVDSNSDPRPIDYVIPANDDAVRSVKLIVTLIADAVIEGRRISEKKSETTDGSLKAKKGSASVKSSVSKKTAKKPASGSKKKTKKAS